MTATLDDELADLQRRLDEALAERDESEAQKAAMAEVLEVINGSVGNPAPVFEAILEKAMRLCEAAFGTFGTLVSAGGEQFHIVAQRGVPAKLAEYLRKPYQAVAGTAMGQFSSGEQFLNIADLNADPDSLSTTPRRRHTRSLAVPAAFSPCRCGRMRLCSER
jgi:two-component system NtrC family sensor kinase